MNLHSENPTLDRAVRQRELVPAERLADCQAVVIGVGAIGRQVALQLAALGMPRLLLCDGDTVQVENLAVQGYWTEDLGVAKVTATAALCQRIHPELEITAFAEFFRRSTARTLPTDRRLIVFLAVDRIQTRRLLWESLRSQATLFLDGRMNAEVLRVLTVEQPATDTYYPSTLFAPEQAHTGSCTARSTLYTATIAAGLLLSQFTRWLRGLPTDADLTLNLLSSELTVLDAPPG